MLRAFGVPAVASIFVLIEGIVTLSFFHIIKGIHCIIFVFNLKAADPYTPHCFKKFGGVNIVYVDIK